MLQLRVRSEYSFRQAYGTIAKILDVTSGPVGICDRFGTWSHVEFQKACKAAGRKPIFGAELAVVSDMKVRR